MKNILPLLFCLFLLACTSPGEHSSIYRRALTYRLMQNECETELEASTAKSMQALINVFELADLKGVSLGHDDYVVRFYETPIQMVFPDPSAPTGSVIEVASAGGELRIERRVARKPLNIDMIPDGDLSWRIKAYVRRWDLMETKNLVECDSAGNRYGMIQGARYYMEIRKGERYHLVTFDMGNYRYQPYMQMMALFDD